MSDTEDLPKRPSPFHRGERAIQERLGLATKAEDIGRRFIRDAMPEEHAEFFEALAWVVLASLDPSGHPAITLFGKHSGFASAPDAQTLKFSGLPDPSDPVLAGLTEGQPVGVLGIQLHDRRRNRVNGRVTDVTDVTDATDATDVSLDSHDTEGGFSIDVDQSFGNCPAYIQKRNEESLADSAPTIALEPADDLTARRRFVERADTFFIASRSSGDEQDHPAGVDASHRGGRPGFVRQEENAALIFPDFSGNKFFNTLGNINEDPRVALVFPDFENGDLLHLKGRAEIVWAGAALEAFAGAERLIRVSIESAYWRRNAMPFRAGDPQPSPALKRTGTWS
ncbi:MAG: putative pyridoxine 5'-phosphate oxidase superfamily flavin-nucleotide-binding protein [Candidatus Binatia bacterium]|jgi:predicted pyridoxine 5'-phosphate oxidase superfamily flavin-nucleotide-binding protein